MLGVLPDDVAGMTWGEFMAWTEGRRRGEYGVTANLLRLIAYQMLTLNPYIDKKDKPIRITDYMRFPYEEVNKNLEYIDPKELARIWKLQD